MSASAPTRTATGRRTTRVSLDGLRKRFDNAPAPAIAHLDLKTEEGEFISLLGPSGCGKTTTLRCVAGFEFPDEGRVRLNDEDITDLPPEKRDIGMVFQNYTLLEAPKAKQTLVHIHASAEELNRVYQADLAINAGMSAAARSLEVLSAPPTLPWEEWMLQAHADYEANLVPQALTGMPAETPRGSVDMAQVVALLQKHLPADAAITNGAGNFASWVHRYFRYHGLAKGAKTQLAPTSGAMGYGVPAGIAANLATGRVASTIAGDGDFLMTGQELATASQHGGKSIIVLLNNGMFGTIRMHQRPRASVCMGFWPIGPR